MGVDGRENPNRSVHEHGTRSHKERDSEYVWVCIIYSQPCLTECRSSCALILSSTCPNNRGSSAASHYSPRWTACVPDQSSALASSLETLSSLAVLAYDTTQFAKQLLDIHALGWCSTQLLPLLSLDSALLCLSIHTGCCSSTNIRRRNVALGRQRQTGRSNKGICRGYSQVANQSWASSTLTHHRSSH